MTEGYDFGALYGMADHSVASPLEPGNYDAIVDEAEWGRTKDGTKGAWTIKFRTTTGDRAGYPLTMTLSINPTKSDGSPNPQGMGILYRQLYAMGIPMPPPIGQPGEQGFWQLGWTPDYVAQVIKGRPVLIKVITDNYDDTARSKVRDIKPARPGAPTQVQQPAQQAQQFYGQQPAGYGQPQGGGMYQGGYQPDQAQQMANAAYQSVGMQPPPPQQQYPPQGQVAPGPWQGQQQPQQGPPPQQYQQQGPPQQQVPGVPPWAQPGGGQPGQGGQAEFTQAGQSQQPWMQGQGQPPAQQGYAPQGQPAPGMQGPAQGYQQGPPQPQFQQPGYPPQNGYGGQPGYGAQPNGAQQGMQPGAPGTAPASPSSQQPQQGQPHPQQGAPELPPWAQ